MPSTRSDRRAGKMARNATSQARDDVESVAPKPKREPRRVVRTPEAEHARALRRIRLKVAAMRRRRK